MRARLIAEEKTATGIGADAQPGLRAFNNNLRRGTCDRRQKPVQAPFPGLEFHFPGVSLEDQFVVPFRDAQDLVDRVAPFARNPFFFHEGIKGLTQGIAQPHCAAQQSLRGVWIGAGKRKKACPTLRGNNVRSFEEPDQLVPGEILCRHPRIGRIVGEIDGKPAANE